MKKFALCAIGLFSSIAAAGPAQTVVQVELEKTIIQNAQTQIYNVRAEEIGPIQIDILGSSLEFEGEPSPLADLVSQISQELDALDGNNSPGTHLNHRPWEALGLHAPFLTEELEANIGETLNLQPQDIVQFNAKYDIIQVFDAVLRFRTNAIECSARLIPRIVMTIDEPTGVLSGAEYFSEARNISSLLGRAEVPVENGDRDSAIAECKRQVGL